eukprot:PhM_4_TR15915/c1_g4_i3/m.3305
MAPRLRATFSCASSAHFVASDGTDAGSESGLLFDDVVSAEAELANKGDDVRHEDDMPDVDADAYDTIRVAIAENTLSPDAADVARRPCHVSARSRERLSQWVDHVIDSAAMNSASMFPIVHPTSEHRGEIFAVGGVGHSWYHNKDDDDDDEGSATSMKVSTPWHRAADEHVFVDGVISRPALTALNLHTLETMYSLMI